MPGPFEIFSHSSINGEFQTYFQNKKARQRILLRSKIASWRESGCPSGEVSFVDGYLKALEDLEKWIAFRTKQEKSPS